MKPDSDGFTLFDLLAVCRSHALAFVVSVSAVLLVFVLYAVVTAPVYRAEVVMMPADSKSTNGLGSTVRGISGLGLFAGLVPADSDSVEALATLESNAFLARFISAHELMHTLYADIWDQNARTWRSDIHESDIPTIAEATKLFRKCCLSIEESPSKDLAKLAVEWREPEIAALWANTIIVDLNTELKMREIAEAEEMISYLQAELEKTNIVGLQQAIFSLLEQQIQRKTLARVRSEYAFRVVDPAIAPAADDYVRPKRLYLIGTGLCGGVLLGLLVVLVLNHLQVLRNRDPIH